MLTSLPVLLAAGIVVAVAVAAIVFTAAFRFALRECAEARALSAQPGLPRATIVTSAGSGARWSRGRAAQRALRGMTLLQAGVVAAGITAVFVMGLCLAAMVGVMFVA